MFPCQIFLLHFSLAIVVVMNKSSAQPSVNGMRKECYQTPTFQSDYSGIADELRSQKRMLETLLESMQTQMKNLSQEVESNLKNLSQKFESNFNNLSLEVRSLKSQIELLRNCTSNCSTVQADENTVFNMSFCPEPEKAATVVFPPQCCSFPFTFQGQLHHRCIPGESGPGCLIQQRKWVTCAEPNDYVARNHSVNTTIPFFGQFTAIHVHNWIVFQQRINGSVSFDRSWEEYKAGFGKHDGNFWMGLEKVHQMTNSTPYKLRMEFMLRNGSWYSVEYDTFRVESEASNYKIHVTGYSGDVYDVMNYGTIEGGRFHNGMNFSTNDRDNDRDSGYCASDYGGGGWWYNKCHHSINLNGWYGSDFSVADLGWCSMSRMMMKGV